MRTILTRCTAIFAILTLVIAGAAPVSAASRRYVALSVGYQHNCALTAQGKAYCWGYNNYGQLGTGDTNNAMVAVPVIGGLKFTSISAGRRAPADRGEALAHRTLARMGAKLRS